MFLTCEIALYLKLLFKCVKSASMAPFSPSCFDVLPQWIISELACYTYSMVVVPLYDTLGPGAIRYIVNTGKNKIVVIFSETSFVAENGSFSSAFQKTGEFTQSVSKSLREVSGQCVVPRLGQGWLRCMSHVPGCTWLWMGLLWWGNYSRATHSCPASYFASLIF